VLLGQKHRHCSSIFLWTLGISLDEKIAGVLISAKQRHKKPFLVGSFGGNYTGKLLINSKRQEYRIYHTPRRTMKAIKFW